MSEFFCLMEVVQQLRVLPAVILVIEIQLGFYTELVVELLNKKNKHKNQSVQSLK